MLRTERRFRRRLRPAFPTPRPSFGNSTLSSRAADSFKTGDIDEGQAALAEVSKSDPKMYIVPFMLGESALRRSDWVKAATELQRCLDLNPNFDQAMTGLARALLGLGKPDEARQWLEKALKLNPKNYRAWYELGSIESETDQAAAIADMEKAISIQPNFASLRRDLGMLQFKKKNYAEAITHLARAAELGVEDGPLFNFLGISYSRTGQFNKAISTYKLGLAIDPGLAEAHLNLGFAYQKLGQSALARKEYAEACRSRPSLCRVVPSRDP